MCIPVAYGPQLSFCNLHARLLLLSQSSSLPSGLNEFLVIIAIIEGCALFVLHRRSHGRTSPVAALVFVGCLIVMTGLALGPYVFAKIAGRMSVRLPNGIQLPNEFPHSIAITIVLTTSLMAATVVTMIVAYWKREEWLDIF
ncbi:MAG: hypothetical protein KDA61_14140 [Planctomycetales bacterium]|nr:hypothetical protein [Planctomycetales bacterium]